MPIDPARPRPAALDAELTRRGFLVRTAGFSAALALGGCAGEQVDTYRALLPPGETPVALGVREYAVLRAFVNRMVPASASRPGADALAVAARVDRELGFHGERLQRDMRDALRLVEWWPLATRRTRFTQLGPDPQTAEIAGMAGSRWAFRRSAYTGLRSLVLFFHYSQPATWSSVGYDGPWVAQGPAIGST